MKSFETCSGYMIHKSEFSRDSYFRLKAKMSTVDFDQNSKTVALFTEGDYCFIPKIKKLELDKILGKEIKLEKLENKLVNNIPYKLEFQPLPHQLELIKEIRESLSNPNQSNSIAVSLDPGLGKTYISANTISFLKEKFIFLVYSTGIIEQARKEVTKIIGKEHADKFVACDTSHKLSVLERDDVWGLFMTTSMFQSCLKLYGVEELSKILLRDLGITTKIIDECDRHTGLMYYINSFFNFKYSIYLTGTPFRSLMPDDQVFQRVIKNIPQFGKSVKVELNREVEVVKFKSAPTRGETWKMNSGQPNAFKLHYNNMLALKDNILDFIFKTYSGGPDKLFDRLIGQGGSIVLFVGRINNCLEVKQKLISRFGIDENDIGILNTSIKNEKKRMEALNKPYIISITSSLGRGIDAKHIRCLVLLEFMFSQPEIIQTISRVGRVGGERGYVIYPVDESITRCSDNYYYRKGIGFFKTYFIKENVVQVPSDWNNNYLNGYDPESEIAKEIMRKEKAKQLKLSKVIKS